MNYFELFDIPVLLTIDQVSLTKKYFELQRLYHRDFHSNAGDERREEILQKSSLIKVLPLTNNCYW